MALVSPVKEREIMTMDMVLVLAIMAGALVLFITEWLRMDVVALTVMSVLALTGLVSAREAIAGFSNHAVVTIWAMFILSEGLTRTGIADLIGRKIIRGSRYSEMRMISVFMIVAGVLSGFMNNIGVAALMMPVAVEAARRFGIVPSRLLLPLAYGTLLGGLTTIMTTQNLLVSSALQDSGLNGFRFFDFTPVGLPILLAGIAFVSLLGRHLLPRKDPLGQPRTQQELQARYGLQERIFALRVPEDSVLSGKTLAEAGLTSAARLVIIAITRDSHTEALPSPASLLREGDTLLAQGRLDRFNTLRHWSELSIERETPVLQQHMWEKMRLYELMISDTSYLIGQKLQHAELREKYSANVLAIRRGAEVRRMRLSEMIMAAGDRLLIQCVEDSLEGLQKSPEFGAVTPVTDTEVRELYRLEERLFVLRVPQESAIVGTTLGENRLGDAFDFRLLAFFRKGSLIEMPRSDEAIMGGDLLLIQGREENLDVLRGLQQLVILEDVNPYLDVFEHGYLEMIEATLHPHGDLINKKVTDLKLRGNFQVELAAIWRDGRSYRSGIEAMTLQRGDALLIVGPRHKLAELNRLPGLIILNPVSVLDKDTKKAPLAGTLMLAVVAAVVFGLFPISIAAVAGATLMVVTRCLTMEQAYNAIHWRSIFLIAGMLPLGVAMEKTGTAGYLARWLLDLLGQFGPWPVIAGLFWITVIGALAIPTAALVLIMVPIALSASAELGVAPQAAMMAVAIAASASFASPVSHPANVLVMGPGGYRFSDYLKLGLPLVLVVFGATVLLLPLFWPLH
ncbi:MAG: SLC13 family permease [Syntrophorhabdus sp.]